MKKAKSNNTIVRCPNCGKIHAVPKEKQAWTCHCKLLGETGRTRKYNVQDTKLEDQKSLILECGVTATPSQGIQMACCDELEQVTIKGYGVITAGAFQDCTSLRVINLSKGVEAIDVRAFAGCLSLEKIVLPDGLKYIGSGAFERSGLRSIIFPDSVTEIEGRAFSYCSFLEEIVLPNGLVRIGPGAFQGTGLKSIIFPESVTSIGNNAFANCCALKKAVLPKRVTTIKEGTFQKSGLTEIICNGSIKLIDSRAFAGCAFLEEIILPEGLERIRDNAFQNSGLKRIAWSDSIWDVHPDALNSCTQLEEVKISPKASVYVPFAKFPQCPFLDTYLAQHTREDGVVESHTCLRDGILIGENGTCLVCCHAQAEEHEIFAYLPEITELCFEPGTQSIDDFMFRGCRNLKRLTLPKGLKKIGEGAFADCTVLEEVVIPGSVEEIAPFAFGKCTSLRVVEISESLLKKLDHSVFALTPFAKNIQQVSTKPWRDVLLVGLGTSASDIVSSIGYKLDFRQDTLTLDTTFSDNQRGSKFISLGKTVCHGNSAKGDPDLGKAAMQEKQEEICRELQEHDFVIVVARLGCGTGSGGAPVLARWLQELNIPHLFIVSVPQPLRYESTRRILQARQSIVEMKKMGTALMVTSNKWVQYDSGFDGYIHHDFAVDYDIMYHTVKNMTELINLTELNVAGLCHADPVLGNASLTHISCGPLYNRENVAEIVDEIVEFIPHINARYFTVYFLVPYDMNPDDIDYAKKMICKTLPAKTSFAWNIIPEEKRENPCVLFITEEDGQKELSLESSSIILEGGYPVLVDYEYIW